MACQPHPRLENKKFFDIDSLVSAQILLLAEKKPELRKEALIEFDSSSVTTVPADSAAWAIELDIFRQLDLINKPVNRDNYEVQDNTPDPTSNLKICSYTARKDIPLSFLRIYYAGRKENIRKIEGLYKEQNALYASSRFLTLELNKVYNDIGLINYSIEGGQKMILGDSTTFRITGVVKYTH